MGRPRIYKDNAAKQKAYRERKARREAGNVTKNTAGPFTEWMTKTLREVQKEERDAPR